jgi:arylsulfatase A-like enzyme
MSHVYLGGPADRRGLVLAHGERDNGAHVEGHPTHLFTEAALSLLESKLAQPFFVTVSYLAPGRPIGLPEAGPRPVEPDDVELPPNFAAEPPYDPGTLGMQEERRLKRPLQAAEARQAWAGYYGRLAYLDQQIGRLLGLLESREDLNDTLVVYAGHSGISLGAHGLLGNMTLYDEGVLAPLIIRGGGAPAGLTSGSLVHLMDLMPTLSNYGSVPAGANLHARSLTPVLSGRRETHRQSLMAYYPNGFRMIRTDRHKLVQNVYAKREELFDLAADPYETADRSTDPAYANALRDLRSELESWWKSMKAPAARA